MSNAPYDTLNTFHKAARNSGLEYFLIGGFAVSYWGAPRFTADVDFVVLSSSLETVKRVAEELDYTLAFLHPNQGFAHFVDRHESTFRIDFMLVNEDTWKKLKESSTVVDFGGAEPIPIVSALHLIAMKLHAAKQPDRTERYKDLNDVVEILLAQGLCLDDLEKAGIMQKHGNETTINELRRLFRSRGQR